MTSAKNAALSASMRLVALTLLTGMVAMLLSPGDARAQGMGSKMDNMPGMGNAKKTETKTATGTGTVTALNAKGHKVTFDHGPMPEINWPAMKMEFPVAPSVDLSKVKTGDKVRFTLSGSGQSYTVQSISPGP
jgi:Cu/Ag efflux protein CusF